MKALYLPGIGTYRIHDGHRTKHMGDKTTRFLTKSKQKSKIVDIKW